MQNDRRLRVCFVSPTYPSDLFPGAFTEYCTAKYLEADVLYLTKHYRGAQIWPPPANIRVVQVSYPDIEIGRGPLAGLRFGLKVLCYVAFLLRSIPSMTRFKPDIVHVISPIPIMHGLFARICLGSKVIVHLIGTDALRLQRMNSVRRVLRYVDRVLCVSQRTVNVLQDLLGDTVAIGYLPRGVDISEFSSAARCERKDQVLCIAGLRWQKGFEYLIPAFRMVRERLHAYRLIIVGTGELQDEIRGLIDKHGLSAHVELVGRKSRSEVSKVLAESKVLVLASVSEGFPKVILEAAASGTPVVVTDVGECSIAREEGFGLVVPPRDAHALASALCRVLEDGRLWLRLSARGPAVAQKYDWKEIAKKLKCIYDDVLGTTPRTVFEIDRDCQGS